MTGLQLWKGKGRGRGGGYLRVCVCANEMAGRSGVTRQGQGCIEGIRAEG